MARARLTGLYGRQADAGEKRGGVASMLAEGAALFGDEGLQPTSANNLMQRPGPDLRQPEPDQATRSLIFIAQLGRGGGGVSARRVFSHCRAVRSHETKDLPAADIANEIHACAVPMIIETPSLDRICGAVRIEQRNALSALRRTLG